MSQNRKDYLIERIKLLKRAINNDYLDGEVCPRCFRDLEIAVSLITQFKIDRILDSFEVVSSPSKYDRKRQGIRKVLSKIKEL